MRFILIGTVCLFVGIGVMGWMKKSQNETPTAMLEVAAVAEPLPVAGPATLPSKVELTPLAQDATQHKDEVYRFFTVSSSRFPFVETITYSPRVSWLKGRPAWLGDYASFFKTSKHFIARSLNGKPDYFTQKVTNGDKFNVFKNDHELSFHLVVDLSRCKMWFYAVDLTENKHHLVKTYQVGLGCLEKISPSGSLTPIGKYLLGDKIATYKPGIKDLFRDEESEMIQVFGTRWIPFGEELENCSHPSKGYGIHGAPWTLDEKGEVLIEDRAMVGRYESDGCIRLLKEDIEELYAIIVTKPTVVEIVKDYQEADIPGEAA